MTSRRTRRRFRLGIEDKVFIAFMAVCFGLLMADRLTGGALEAAFQAWRAAP